MPVQIAAPGDHVVQLFLRFFSKVEIHSISHHDYIGIHITYSGKSRA